MFNLKSGASASHSANSLKRNVHHAGVARPCCGLLRAAVEAGQVPASATRGHCVLSSEPDSPGLRCEAGAVPSRWRNHPFYPNRGPLPAEIKVYILSLKSIINLTLQQV